MRVLFVLENYLPHIGGVEVLFKNLCEGLARRGHDVTILTHQLPGTRWTERLGGVRVIRVPCMDSRYIFTFAAIPAALRYAKDADIIHTTTFNAAPPAWLAARLRGKPVVITVMETWVGKWRSYTNFSWPKATLHELLERALFLLPYDRYAVISDSTLKQLREVVPRRSDRLVKIYPGFDPAMWRKRYDTQPLRARLGLRDKFIILGYGRPGTSKGFEYLVDAFARIRKEMLDAALVLILSRDKQYAREVERMRRDHPEIMFLPSVPYQELPSYVQMADCVVVPSVTEGFGYTTIEASSSGTPVVASNTTSIPEVIHGKHVLVKPCDPRAIADGVLRVRARKYRRAKAKVFRWKDTLNGYERLYKGVRGGAHEKGTHHRHHRTGRKLPR